VILIFFRSLSDEKEQVLSQIILLLRSECQLIERYVNVNEVRKLEEIGNIWIKLTLLRKGKSDRESPRLTEDLGFFDFKKEFTLSIAELGNLVEQERRSEERVDLLTHEF